MKGALGVSERRACRTLGQPHSTQRRTRRVRNDEVALTEAVVRLAAEYGRYGYRRITAMLRTQGWHVNAKRVQRIWRREGLKVPRRQPKRGRLWLADGVRTLFIECGSPWENGSKEAFNGRLRDELLDREIFHSFREADVLIEQWRQHDNTVRPHSALGCRPPAPETVLSRPAVPACAAPRHAQPGASEHGPTLS